MTLATSKTLRPGLLVSLKTSITGNVSYITTDIEKETITKKGAARAKWETERTVADPAEFEAAIKVRGRVRGIIGSICAKSEFGLLCPEADAEDLEKAIAEARRIADEFNKSASLTKVRVYIITGRVAPDDVEAVCAINSEVRDLLTTMTDGIKNLDVKSVRDACNRVRSVGMMLPPDTAARIQGAIDAARATCRRIVQAGEQAAQEIDKRTIRAITEARTAFLDIEDTKAVVTSKAAPAPAIDLAPSAKPAAKAKAKPTQIEV